MVFLAQAPGPRRNGSVYAYLSGSYYAYQKWVFLSGLAAAGAWMIGNTWLREGRHAPESTALSSHPAEAKSSHAEPSVSTPATDATTVVAPSFPPDADAPPSPDLLTGPVERLAASAQPGARPLFPATERVYLVPNEAVRVPLNRAALSAAAPVVLRADHGGVLEGRALSPQVELPAGAEAFTFHAGGHRGRYTVSVSQGLHSETLEFWVGEEPPRGRPGPARVFTAPSNISADS